MVKPNLTQTLITFIYTLFPETQKCDTPFSTIASINPLH